MDKIIAEREAASILAEFKSARDKKKRYGKKATKGKAKKNEEKKTKGSRRRKALVKITNKW